MAIDCCVVLLALFVVPPGRVAYSVLAAVLMSLFLGQLQARALHSDLNSFCKTNRGQMPNKSSPTSILSQIKMRYGSSSRSRYSLSGRQGLNFCE